VALLATATFVPLARMQMRALGDDALALIVVAHPIGGIAPVELDARRADAAAQGVSWLEAEVGRREQA
jgi:hypothetical protein